MDIRVSVVVPTSRRSPFLERCLKALLTQNFPPEDFEIIVVDEAASEKTRTHIDLWNQQIGEGTHCVRYIPMTDQQGRPGGPAAARNVGWKAARADIIAFTNDDFVPEIRWLQFGLAAFTADVDGISGTIRVPLPQHPTDYEYETAHLERSEFTAANTFYRRMALEAVGGFDERFTSIWGEDSDLYFTLRERGFRCVTLPTAAVVHPPRQPHWGVSLTQQRKNMFNALLYKKHPALFRQTFQHRPPWHYYSILGTLFIILASGIAQRWPLLIVALIAWVLMTLSLCLVRLRHTSRMFSHILEVLITSILIPPLSIFWQLWGAIKFRVLFL